mgnify:CR=1 FL=1
MAILPALILVASACGASGTKDGAPPPGSGAPSTQAEVTTTSTPYGVLPTGPSALDDPTSPEFPPPLVAVVDIRSGVPPPDGIPAIDDPKFVSQEVADAWWTDAEPVVVVEIGTDARAYPAQVLIWHEIVNDVVDGVPIAVTYCPLCNSAVAYERTINGVVTTFGTSGRLYNSALVMYDRATESLWTHYDGRAVVGVLAGTQLERIPAPLMAWEDFRSLYPDGLVLDRTATGFERDYGRNPYVGYDEAGGSPFLFRGTVDDRAAAMRRVVGVTLGDASAAWALDAVDDTGPAATNGEVGSTPVVIFWQPGQVSALETDDTGTGRDVGSVGVFLAAVDGRTLTFSAGTDGFEDQETGSRWDLAGRAVAGPLSGARLERIPHFDTFWFAWSTYRPETTLIEETAAG